MRQQMPTRRLIATLLALSTASCQDNVQPGPPPVGVSQVAVTYVCDNDFDLRNRSSAPQTVQYRVVGTSETGDLVLPAGSGDTATVTRLTTLQAGAVQIFQENAEASPVANNAVACPLPVSAPQPQATLGEWAAPIAWPVVAVHLHLLPDSRVLSWGRLGAPQIWDPSTGVFTPAPIATMVFCSGHAFLPDGRLLVTGGHIDDERGLPDANIFDAAANRWTSAPPMRWGRWYPTSTTLTTGEILTIAGSDQSGTDVPTPEVWDGSSWRALVGANRILPYYPRVFVAPNGLVFYAGELRQSAYLDPTGSGKWIPVASSHYGRRDYGSAVMYRPGKVMILGGSDPPDGQPTSSVELIDLNDPSPSWRFTEPMHHARRQFNATLLPDGEVLATGGTSLAGFSNRAGAVHAAEAWAPASARWTELASNQVARVYHSTTLLLPDGRILHAGSGDGPGLPRELNAEIYSPPYLFRGPRPLITDAPETIGYNADFVLSTPEPGRVVRATLIRLSSVTHAFDQDQRFLELSIRRTGGGLTVSAPASPALAPPGPYLLFILNGAGVPSLARVLRLG
jgi:galactose oxidase